MSVTLARKTRDAETTAAKRPAKNPRIGARDDAFEREADRMADAVSRGERVPRWSFGKIAPGQVQRQPVPDPSTTQQPTDVQPNNYKDAAAKLGEAFLQTDIGKKLKDAVSQDPLVKGAEDFLGTLPGKMVAGAAATAAVSTLAATHKALPAQIPEIPLDAVKPGLKVKLTYEGPVDHPTKAMITFSFTPGESKKKKEPTTSQRYLGETEPIAASMDEIRKGMHYAPGTPEEKQEEADRKMLEDAMARRLGTLPGTGGRPLVPPAQAGQTGTGVAGWTFSPLVNPELDKKMGLQPLAPSAATQKDADKKKPEEIPVQRKAEGSAAVQQDATAVEDVLRMPGQAMDGETQRLMERRFAFDFSRVRVHTDAQAAASAKGLGAAAYTSGEHVIFAADRYAPRGAEGLRLLAHELAHVVQQSGRGCFGAGMYARGAMGAVQRKIAMRDVGRGEQSGFAHVPELVSRLNAMSSGLTFAVDGGELKYTVKEGGTLSNFDTQMQGFIDQATVLPLRFTNRHGLLGSRATGFNDRVAVDDWSSGYVDIEDLLASNDLGLQNALVHFLRERTATANYAHRIGDLDTNPDTEAGRGHQAELDRAHAQGIQAELAVLRDFFSDPAIHLIDHDSGGDVFRVYRNSRRDTIRTRVRAGRGANAGVDAVIVEVVTRDGHVHTPEEYKAILAAAPPPAATGTATGAAHAP
jgi:uncharacterized protein DUF4157